MEEEKSSSDENVAPAAKAIEAGCPICLESFKDKAFVDVCFHTFCYSCILQWADVVSSCPMCKAPFKSIIHNVRSTDSYDQHEIKPKPVLVSQEVSLAEARRFWYRTTRLSSSKKSRTKGSASTKRSVPKGRHIAAEKRRRAIYAANLLVKPLPAQDGIKKVREITPKFFKSNPAASHRLIPWLTREFKVIVGEEDSSFVIALINSLLDTYDITSPEFAQQLQPFLFEKTAHFVHEFVSFARAPCDMVSYDEKAEYDVPPDGTPLPELVPLEDEPGPSGLHQKYFDEAVQDGKRGDDSPTMKQHPDEDDDSDSVSSHDDKDQEKTKSMVYSRDIDNRSRYDGSSSHRQKRSDYHDSRDRRRRDSRDRRRRDSRDRHRDSRDQWHDDRRRHSHSHRSDDYRCRNYSSGSSTERHSKRRQRSPSSGSDRGHSSKYSRGSDKYRKHSRGKDYSRSSHKRHSNSSGKKKHRRHSSESSSSRSSSPTRHASSKKSHRAERKGSLTASKTEAVTDSIQQAPDAVLQQELVNLEEQINVDKKMLLKNLLRKERLALLHDSIDKEQLEDDSLDVSDTKLKEELQHLDEAITTGKTALISVMKRINSTDSTHDTTEQ